MSLESRHVLAYVSWVTGPLTWEKRKSEEEEGEKHYVAGIQTCAGIFELGDWPFNLEEKKE